MDIPLNDPVHLGHGLKPSRPDPWAALSRHTSARIALGRAGGSWRTQSRLDFQMAHARARDAVGKNFDLDLVAAQIKAAGYETARLASQANDHALFLRRPDLGRKLSEEARTWLSQNAGPWIGRDLAVLVSDGLSALAAEKQAAPLLTTLLPLLIQAGWTICPVFLIPFARVKIQDEVGGQLQVRHTLMLLGERPGLGSPDSLGAYFTFRPGPDRSDADRNCVSNIRPGGMAPREAGLKLAQSLIESARQGCSGIKLQEPSLKAIRSIPEPR